MKVEEIKVKFSADISDIKGKTSELVKQLKDANTTLSDISGMFKEIVQPIKQMATSLDTLTKATQNVGKASEKAVDAQKDISKSTAETSKNIDKATQKHKENAKAIEEQVSATKKLNKTKGNISFIPSQQNKFDYKSLFPKSPKKIDGSSYFNFKSPVSKNADIDDDVSGDISRAMASGDKDKRKIGEDLQKNVNEYNKATQNVNNYANSLSNLSAKVDNLKSKLNATQQSISSHAQKIQEMEFAYERMSTVMDDFGISGSINAEMERLQGVLDTNKNRAYELEQAMERISHSGFDVGFVGDDAMSLSQIAQEIDRIDLESEQAYARLSQMRGALDGVSTSMLGFGSENGLSKLNTQLTQARAKMLSLQSSEQTQTNALSAMSGRLEQANQKMQQSQARAQGLASKIRDLRASLGTLSSTNVGGTFANLSAGLSKFGNAFSTVLHKFKSTGSALASTAKRVGEITSRFNIFSRVSEKASNSISQWGQKTRQNLMMIKSIVFSMLLMKLFTIMSEGFASLASQSSKFNASMSGLYSSFAYLKNAITGAFSPILTYVQPILSSLVNSVADAVNKIGELFAKLTGQKTYTRAVYQHKDYASSVSDTASATDKATEATENATKANEEYQNSLMGFDKIQKISDNNTPSTNGSGSGAGGSGGAGGVGDANAGAWVEETVNINSSIIDSIKDGDWYQVGYLIGEKLNEAMASIKWDKIHNKAKEIGTNIANFVNGGVDGTDWSLVGSTIGNGINTAIIFANTMLEGINFKNIGASLATALNSMGDTVDWRGLGNVIGNGFKSIIDTVSGFVSTLDFSAIGTNFAKALKGVFEKIDLGDIGQIVSDALIGVFDFGTSFLKEIDWGQLGSDIVSAIFDFIKNIDWGQLAKSAWEFIKTAFTSILDYDLGVLSGLADNLGITDLAINLSANVSTKISEVKQWWGNLTAEWKDKASDLKLKVVTAIKNIKTWWNERVVEWKDKTASLKQKAETTINNIKSWWSERASEWKDKVSNFSNKVGTTVSKVKSWWSERASQWKDKTTTFSNRVDTTVSKVRSWWSERANQWRDKQITFSIRMTYTAQQIASGFKSAINTIIGWINRYIISPINRISITIPQIRVAGRTLYNGRTLGFNVPRIQTFADGGFPDGENGLFFANSSELVGKFTNGKTAVANNEMIVQGIEAGVYNAVTSALSASGGSENRTINVYVGGEKITDYVVNDINNRTIATGQSPILV